MSFGRPSDEASLHIQSPVGEEERGTSFLPPTCLSSPSASPPPKNDQLLLVVDPQPSRKAGPPGVHVLSQTPEGVLAYTVHTLHFALMQLSSRTQLGSSREGKLSQSSLSFVVWREQLLTDDEILAVVDPKDFADSLNDPSLEELGVCTPPRVTSRSYFVSFSPLFLFLFFLGPRGVSPFLGKASAVFLWLFSQTTCTAGSTLCVVELVSILLGSERLVLPASSESFRRAPPQERGAPSRAVGFSFVSSGHLSTNSTHNRSSSSLDSAVVFTP